jgi:hypothetical protein
LETNIAGKLICNNDSNPEFNVHNNWLVAAPELIYILLVSLIENMLL